MPAISVIIPVYNTEKYLPQCLDSVLMQSFADFEIIAVDDGSTDASGRICDEYALRDSRIRVFHRKNQGVSCARNQALAEAVGKYVIFLDSDDYWTGKDNLGKLYRVATESDADLVRGGQYISVDESGKQMADPSVHGKRKRYVGKILSPSVFLSHIVRGEFFIFLFLVRREKLHGLQFNTRQVFLEDMDFVCRLMCTPLRCVYVDDRFYAYRKHDASVSCRPDIRHLDDSFSMCRRFDVLKGMTFDRRLKKIFSRYRVMMYYWTLQTLATDPFYEDRHHIIDKYNLAGLRKDVNSWFWEDCLSGFSLVFFMSPAAGTVYLRKRTGVTLPIRKAMSKLRKIFSAG